MNKVKIAENPWPIRLFNKSALKQHKYEKITGLLGETDQLHCLDIGADNGVISYLLRERSGSWKSADLDDTAVQSIQELVQEDVFQIDGGRTPFADNEFDRVVIVDFLEHIESDKEFIDELFRIIKPGGELIINVPHIKNSLLRKFRLKIGQTDEKHGHLRPGYTAEGLKRLLSDKFTIRSHQTYSKFFSESVDTFMTFGFGLLKKDEKPSQKGVIVTGQDMRKYKNLFKAYSLVYPFVSLFALLDKALFWRSGYMLIVKAEINEKRFGER